MFRVKGTHIKLPRRHPRSYLATTEVHTRRQALFALGHVRLMSEDDSQCYAKIWQTWTHICTKSFFGSLRLWFKKFVLAAVQTVPTRALHEQG